MKHFNYLLSVFVNDQTLAAAYRGEIEGVNPGELMLARAKEIARIFSRTLREVLDDLAEARAVVTTAPRLCRCGEHDSDPESCPVAAADLRHVRYVRYLPEAGVIQGHTLLLSEPEPRGPGFVKKIVIHNGSPEHIRAFMEIWAPKHGLKRIYGDIASGSAGGYPK
jgi:hypothetical protein